MLGVVLSLSAGLGFGASAVLARLAMQHIHATTVTLVSLIAGTLITMALAFASIPRRSWDWPEWRSSGFCYRG